MSKDMQAIKFLTTRTMIEGLKLDVNRAMELSCMVDKLIPLEYEDPINTLTRFNEFINSVDLTVEEIAFMGYSIGTFFDFWVSCGED